MQWREADRIKPTIQGCKGNTMAVTNVPAVTFVRMREYTGAIKGTSMFYFFIDVEMKMLTPWLFFNQILITHPSVCIIYFIT